jgi:hypothetical protein
MSNLDIYNQIYTSRKFPSEYQEYLYPLFEEVVSLLSQRITQSVGLRKSIDLSISLTYLVEEHVFNMHLLDQNFINSFMNNRDYYNHLRDIVVDKIFFNEYLEYRSVAIIDKCNPLISTLTLFLNFIINKYEQIPQDNNKFKLVLDILKKGFLMTKSITNLLCDGFETEAFSTWRTIHEVECLAKIIFDKPYLSEYYLLHMKYNNIYHNGAGSKEETDKFYEEIKAKLKEKDLKSKDLKKYLEYGWLYGIKDYQKEYPDLKLNFRKGIEYVAGLTSYASLYEASSEIAHSSPLLIYSNKAYYRDLSLICIYETFLRMEAIFYSIIKTFNEINSNAYESMRELYCEELNKNLLKLKIATLKSQKNK